METRKEVIDGSIPFVFASARHTNVKCASHMHENMEIVIVNKGTLNMAVSGRKYAIQSHQGVFIPPFEAHSFRSPEDDECHVIMFSKSLVSYFYELLGSYEPTRHIFDVSDASYSLSDEILPEVNNTADYIDARAILAPLCREIYLKCGFRKRETPFDDSLTAAMEYMYAHFDEDLSLSDVAKAVGMHPSTLSKGFSGKTGVKFSFYLQYVRCYHAAELMKSGGVNITEAAYASGFGCIRSFNRAFKRVYDVTPSEYLKGKTI